TRITTTVVLTKACRRPPIASAPPSLRPLAAPDARRSATDGHLMQRSTLITLYAVFVMLLQICWAIDVSAKCGFYIPFRKVVVQSIACSPDDKLSQFVQDQLARYSTAGQEIPLFLQRYRMRPHAYRIIAEVRELHAMGCREERDVAADDAEVQRERQASVGEPRHFTYWS